MQVREIYAGSAGETHSRIVDLPYFPRDFAPPSAPAAVSEPIPVTTAVFMQVPVGWDPEFHCTPRRQLGFTIAGRITITLSDGSDFDCYPGSMPNLLNDVVGKGHRTMVQGGESATFLLIGLDGEAE